MLTFKTDKQIFKDVTVGENFIAWHFVNLYGCILGDNVKVGSYTEIGPAIIGNNVVIGAQCFIPENITIEDDCWIGPGTLFCNDRFPPSVKEKWEKTIVKKGARIGASVTILPGVTIGQGSLIGAGSTVTKNIPDGEIWAGNPAVRLR